MKERFYIDWESWKAFSSCSEVIKDKANNDKIVCEDIYETEQLLNELQNKINELEAEKQELIQMVADATKMTIEMTVKKTNGKENLG